MNSLKEEEALPHHENGMGVEPEEKIEKEKIEDKKENSSQEDARNLEKENKNDVNEDEETQLLTHAISMKKQIYTLSFQNVVYESFKTITEGKILKVEDEKDVK